MRFAPIFVLLAACDTIAPPPSPGPAPTPIAPKPAVRPPPLQPLKPPDLGPQPVVEVEVRGQVDTAGAPAGKLVVVLTDGPCFQPGSHYIGTMPARAGQQYFIEVFPPRGTKLDVCAAMVVGGNRVTPWHGRAAKAPLLAVGQGDVMFNGVDIKLAKGEPVTLPASIKIE